MFIGKKNDRVRKIVTWVVVAAFVLSTGIIGIYALVDRQLGGAQPAYASYIATVNGRGIDYGSFIENYNAIYQQYPYFSPGESQYWLRSFVLEQMIAGELLRAEAEKSSIKVDDAKIDQVIEEYKAAFSDPDDFYGYLQSRQMTEADFRKSVRSSLMVEEYIARLQETATVTEEEIAAEFEARKAEDESLVFDEVKDTIESELLAKKRDELLTTHIQELRNSASVEIFDPVINAINAAESGNYEAAAEYYNEAIDSGGEDDPYLHLALGRVLEKLEDMDGALAAFEKAAEIDGGATAEIQLYLGMAYKEREMTDKAVEAFRKASEIDGETDSYLHSILKSEFEELGLTEDAQREQEIVSRIEEEMAKRYEEYLKQLEEAQQSAESDNSSDAEAPSDSQTEATVDTGETGAASSEE